MACNSCAILSCVISALMAVATGCTSVKPSNEEVWVYSTPQATPQANVAVPATPDQSVIIPPGQLPPSQPIQPNLSGLGADWNQNAPYVGQASVPANQPVALPDGMATGGAESYPRFNYHRLGNRFSDEFHLALADCGNFYTYNTLTKYLLGLGGTAILANTSMDEHFRNWYQDDVRSSGTDDVVNIIRPIGRGQYMIPVMAGVAALSTFYDDTPTGSVVADFSFRTTRGFLVGAPTLLFTQYLIGSQRPGESERGSYWVPFGSAHGASGDAFIGAVPFITAAKMTDCPWLKGGFYFLSTVPAWGRINDDRHYLSQVIMGWWIAYLACDAVNKTAHRNDAVTFAPIVSSDMVGVGVLIQR